jgi:mono/diheme cytochrome c family protein
MRRVLLLSVSAAVFAVAMSAQDAAEYKTWMQTAGATAGSLHKNLDAKNAEAAAADAKKLQEIFSHVHEYWMKKDVADAMKFAMNASEGFGIVAADASASKFDEASATLKATSANCGGCHTVHREKLPEGGFKIK